MLLNVSHNDKEVKRKITELVGPSFSLVERVKKGGIGSPRMVILSATEEISKLLEKDSIRNYCNIELRPKGILFGFRSKLESYVLLIPYYKLVLFKANPEQFSLYMDQFRITVGPSQNLKAFQLFFKKLQVAKNEGEGIRIEDV